MPQMSPEVKAFVAIEKALADLTAEQKSRVFRAFQLLNPGSGREEDEAAE